MTGCLGIDTSNYTTSGAVWRDGEATGTSRLLPVAPGEIGLRQSEALFEHVRELGGVVEQVMGSFSCGLRAVGVSSAPRGVKGSYMPCFLAGVMAAQAVSAALRIPMYTFSHQAGHIAAALLGSGTLDWLGAPFLAFHLSGGTTECLLVNDLLSGEITPLSATGDLNAGQLVDRVGKLLGLEFPAGPALDGLARQSDRSFRVRAAVRQGNVCLSGVENQCAKLVTDGEKPCDTAKFCIDSIDSAILGMTGRARELYPGRKLVYAGGVTGNSLIRESVTRRFGKDCVFASPAFSADNAAGIAVLCGKSYKKERRE